MYTLLIADDERIEREALRFIITRATTSIDRIIEAVNGTEAISIAEREQPDIVFLDIKMPGTNGIDAARAIKARLPSVQIIFLTAFDYFDYAHEAIRIGVNDFIVKPATDERVMEVLTRASAELDARRTREKQQPSDERRRQQMIELLERELIHDLMLGELDREQLSLYLNVFDIPTLEGYPTCVVLDYESYPMVVESDAQRTVLKKRALAAIRSTLREAGIPMFGSDQHPALQLLLRCGELETNTLQERLETAAGVVWRTLSIQIRMGVGARASESARFADGFAQATAAVHTAGPLSTVSWYQAGLVDVGYRDGATGNTGSSSNGAERETAHGPVAQVEQYIRAHFGDELSLEQAARMVRLSPFYFSKVFKQHSGTNFVDYVNRIRIDRACELLREGQFSIKEIAARVGYTDANYFARMFKRRMGETPSGYRRRMRR
ncbi:MAG: response regulator [Spirochaetaceae bacterium]|nr:MAG: response regulator [Spirochaetaceae bacterium]